MNCLVMVCREKCGNFFTSWQRSCRSVEPFTCESNVGKGIGTLWIEELVRNKHVKVLSGRCFVIIVDEIGKGRMGQAGNKNLVAQTGRKPLGIILQWKAAEHWC